MKRKNTKPELFKISDEHTPRGRYYAHLEFWGESPPEIVRGLLANLDNRINSHGSVGTKGLLILAKLDVMREEEKSHKPRSAGGDSTARVNKSEREKRKQEAIKIYNSLPEELGRGRTAIVAKRMNLSPGTIRDYFREK